MTITLQKANFWKRISAYLFDIILTITLVLGVAVVVSSVVDYDACLNDYSAKQEFYIGEVEKKYGIDLDLEKEKFDAMSEEEQKAYNETKEIAEQEWMQAMNADKEAREIFSKLFTLTLLIISLSLLISIFVIYFVVPLLFKNGQTLGKKIFGLGVVRTNFVKISNPVLFIRSIIGFYAMETMFPVLMMLMVFFQLLGGIGLIILVLFLGLQIGVMIATKTNSSIHDLLSDTVVVDFASQQIFDTEEELIAFKEKEHEIEVQNARA